MDPMGTPKDSRPEILKRHSPFASKAKQAAAGGSTNLGIGIQANLAFCRMTPLQTG